MNIEPEDDPTHEPEYLFDGEQPIVPDHSATDAEVEANAEASVDDLLAEE